MDRKLAQDRILRRGWLSAQPQAFQNAVLARARLVSCRVGSLVVAVGDGVGGIYGVAGGSIGVHVPQLGQSLALAHVVRWGFWFGYGPMMTRRQRVLEFSVLQPSVLFHVPLGLLDELAGTAPESARALFSITEHGMDIAIATIATLQIRNAEQRIAATLLRIASVDESEAGGPVDIPVSQAQLGEMANAARDVVNRVLGEMERRGLLRTAYRRITVLDVPALARFAEGTGETGGGRKAT